MRGWPYESARHSLSARGISTRGIPHTVHPSEDVELYYKTMKRQTREFVGSGLEDIEVDDVVTESRAILDLFSIKNYDLKDYDLVLNDFIKCVSVKGESKEKNYQKVLALNELMHHRLEIESVYVYGSRVKGYHEEGSDIDVFVVIREDPKLKEILTKFRKATMSDAAWPNNDVALALISKQWIESLRFMHSMRHWIPNDLKTPPGKIFDEKGNEIRMDVTLSLRVPPKKYDAKKIWEVS